MNTEKNAEKVPCNENKTCLCKLGNYGAYREDGFIFLLLPGSLFLASPLLSPAVGKPSLASSNFPSSKLAFSSLTPLQHCLPSFFPTENIDNFPTRSQHSKVMQPSALIVDIREQCTAHCIQPPPDLEHFLSYLQLNKTLADCSC